MVRFLKNKILFSSDTLLAYLVLIVAFVTTPLWDEQFFFWVVGGRIAFFNDQVVWFTTYGFLFLLAVLAGLSFKYWNEEEKKNQVLLLLSLLSAFFLSYLVKYVFQEPRPYELFQIIPLAQERTLSFPSSHTALAFSLVPLLYMIRPRWGRVWLLLSFLVGFSRIYIGVHMPSEVLAGAILGLMLGDFFRILKERYNFWKHWNEKLEIRRQTFHLVFGLCLIFLIKWGILPTWFILLTAFVGLLLSALSLRLKVPVIAYFLARFERPALMHTFPGRGAFFFVFGAWLTLSLFDFYIALAAIAILAFMDSVAHVVGKYWGKIPNPLNPKKHLEGFAAGLLAGFFGAVFFVPVWVALVGACLGSFIEIFELRLAHYKIDDNLIVPTFAALAMTLAWSLV